MGRRRRKDTRISTFFIYFGLLKNVNVMTASKTCAMDVFKTQELKRDHHCKKKQPFAVVFSLLFKANEESPSTLETFIACCLCSGL